jgi:hypothetical protein
VQIFNLHFAICNGIVSSRLRRAAVLLIAVGRMPLTAMAPLVDLPLDVGH